MLEALNVTSCPSISTVSAGKIQGYRPYGGGVLILIELKALTVEIIRA